MVCYESATLPSNSSSDIILAEGDATAAPPHKVQHLDSRERQSLRDEDGQKNFQPFGYTSTKIQRRKPLFVTALWSTSLPIWDVKTKLTLILFALVLLTFADGGGVHYERQAGGQSQEHVAADSAGMQRVASDHEHLRVKNSKKFRNERRTDVVVAPVYPHSPAPRGRRTQRVPPGEHDGRNNILAQDDSAAVVVSSKPTSTANLVETSRISGYSTEVVNNAFASPNTLTAYQEPTNLARLRSIEAEIEFSWASYWARARGHDEVGPISGAAKDWDYSLAFFVDGLDTLLLAAGSSSERTRTDENNTTSVSLPSHVDAALRYLCQGEGKKFLLGGTSRGRDSAKDVSFFETTIRRLGGLLGAYHVWETGFQQRVQPAFDEERKNKNLEHDSTSYPSCFQELIRDTAIRLQTAFAEFPDKVRRDSGTKAPPHKKFFFPRGEVTLFATEDDKAGTFDHAPADQGRFNSGRTQVGLAEAGSNLLEFEDAAAILQAPELAERSKRVMAEVNAEVRRSYLLPAAPDGDVRHGGRETRSRSSLPGRLIEPMPEKDADENDGRLYLRSENRHVRAKSIGPLGAASHSEKQLRLHSSGQATVSAGTDSYYEYLLKGWLMANPGGGTGAARGNQEDYLQLWVDAMRTMRSQLMRPIPQTFFTAIFPPAPKEHHDSDQTPATLYFLADTPGASTMQHLGCYVPGMMILALYGTEGERDAVALPGQASGKKLPFLVRAGFLSGQEEFDAFLQTAKHLLRTCLAFHDADERFLAPEVVRFGKRTGKMGIIDGKNQLRPEILESLFYFYYFDVDIVPRSSEEKRHGKGQPAVPFPHFDAWSAFPGETADGRGGAAISTRGAEKISSSVVSPSLSRSRVYYRNFAWRIFSVFKKFAKTKYGYASTDVVEGDKVEGSSVSAEEVGEGDEDGSKTIPRHEDKEESFWLAETLKYLYMIFQEPVVFGASSSQISVAGTGNTNSQTSATSGIIDLNQFVLNTEGHPVRRRVSSDSWPR
ncbi:unnamed protein product [Amoebophrya sp. A120]|nr:unnamed protein product [Amoebophrya sp. A120]|eukprot:GSA120T00021073001.1